MQKSSRLKRELKQLSKSPSHGISCWTVGENVDQLEATIIGQEGTPYNGGVFKLSIIIPERYPFEPPQVRFKTPIYHPNIDTAGRICLDILKMPPKGAWRPAHNISTLLKSIQVLIADPNPDDPLMIEISSELKCNRQLFDQKAKQWTQKYATENDLKASKPLAGPPESHKAEPEAAVKYDRKKQASKRPGETTDTSLLNKKNRIGGKLFEL
ncbi:ubiquitin-conjugating enzyme E2 T-like isoform X2 [Rhopilema esculentum]|uniref:ubiquitin-conjugating enzyme E2 T-like isoform X2 n=1 Tax=Rhopilema esculentum TaxID=499914 RepID=UPI0031CDDB11